MTQDKDAADKLLDHNRQQLSAMMDDALSPDEARFLLRRLQHDESLAQCLSRWQLCGDILRGHAHAPAPAGFAQRVALAIAGDTEAADSVRPPATAWRPARWGTGLALAASVAVIALFVARQTPELATSGQASQSARITTPAITTPAQADPAQADPGAADPVAGGTMVARTGGAAVRTTPAAPKPESPAGPGTVADIAAVAAVAELPRRAAARRSRAQSQRAAMRNVARQAGPQVAVAAQSSPATSGSMVADAGTAAAMTDTATVNPFTPRAGTITTRPWPRALLPAAGAGGGFNVDYGRPQQESSGFYPFQLRTVPVLEPSQQRATQPIQSESVDNDAK